LPEAELQVNKFDIRQGQNKDDVTGVGGIGDKGERRIDF
jgi:hypothetical protein